MNPVFDALTMRAVADELTTAIVGGRVQRVGLTDERTLVLEIFARGTRHQLLISDHPQAARVHLVSQRLTGDAARVTPLLLLARKHVRGGRIVGLRQPAFERTLALSIVKAHPPVKERDEAPDDDAAEDEGEDGTLLPGWTLDETTLVIEIMGRHSNAVLVGADGAILDALKRVPPTTSRVRPILPHLPYMPPPPQEKADPSAITAAQLRHLCLLAGEKTTLASALVGSLGGISPQVSRELAFRATGRVDAPATACDADRLVAALREIVRPMQDGGWQPVLYVRDGVAIAFSPIPLLSLATNPEMTAEEVPSISAIIARFFAETDRATAHGERRNRLLHAIGGAAARIDTRLAALRGELKRAEDAELNRRKGEAIYAHAYAIAPRQTALPTDDGLTIALDAALSPSENAQRYFEQYRKAQRATEGLPERVMQAETERGYLGQMAALVETATAFDDLVTLEREWHEYTGARASTPAKPQRGRPRPPAARRPRAYTTPAGHRLLVGRSGPQNEQVTFTLSHPDDTWLHARGVGGAHVIVQWSAEHVPNAADDANVLEIAARLAAYYSSARTAGHVEVDFAPRRQVRKIAGAGPGMVTYRGERTLRVEPVSLESLVQRGSLRAPGGRGGE
jgi:predicted ribosome quality control (RQC) complex YloA/Tae2 family protein